MVPMPDAAAVHEQRLARLAASASMKTLDQTVHATSGSAAASTRTTPAGTGSSCPAGTAHLLGVAAAGEQGAHLVADRPARDALAEAATSPLHSSPGYSRRTGRRRVEALALHEVGAVDAGRDDVDEHLAGAGGRGGTSSRTRASGPPGSGMVMAFIPPPYAVLILARDAPARGIRRRARPVRARGGRAARSASSRPA